MSLVLYYSIRQLLLIDSALMEYGEIRRRIEKDALSSFGMHFVIMNSFLPRLVMWLFNDAVLTLLSSPLSPSRAVYTFVPTPTVCNTSSSITFD